MPQPAEDGGVMSAPDPIVDALRERRIELGLTQADVAKRRGFAWYTAQVSRAETGQASPTLVTLRSWANALNCDLVLVRRDVPAPPEVIAERRRILLGN